MEKKYFKDQLQIFNEYLKKNTVTCSMASKILNIPQKNLTRYKRTLQKAGKLKVCFLAECKITNYKAEYLTTNPDLIKTLME